MDATRRRGQAARSRQRIVVIEDDPDVRALWLENLADAGYHVIGVGRGDEALEILADHEPALIVSDVVMPGMDGLEFMRRLRSTPGAAPIPVVFVSALAEGVRQMLGQEFSAHELGATDVLAKPVGARDLVDAVRRAVGEGDGGFRGIPRHGVRRRGHDDGLEATA